MIKDLLISKYGHLLESLDIYENKTSIKLDRIVVKPDFRDDKEKKVGTSVMTDLINYADRNKQIIVLTPSSDFGGDVNRLVQFYKRFGFKLNQGYYKNYEFTDKMIRYPKMNEIKNTIKTILREGLLTKTDKDTRKVAEFVNFCKKYLGIDDDVKVALAFEKTDDIVTTAYYNLDGYIKVYVKGRLLCDIMRSIGHELTHHKQNLDGRLTDTVKDGADGSELENEANAVAGKIIRIYGKLHPDIYE